VLTCAAGYGDVWVTRTRPTLGGPAQAQDPAVSHRGTRRRRAEETARVDEGGGESFCQVLGNPSCEIRTVGASRAEEEGSPAGWFSATFRPKFRSPGPTSSTSCRVILD